MAGKEGLQHSKEVLEIVDRKDPRLKYKTRPGLQKLVLENGGTRVLDERNLLSTFGTKDNLLFKPDPHIFQPVHTVLVETADGEIKEFIRDGHHRAKAAFELWDPIVEKFGYGNEEGQFQFRTYNMTSDVLDKYYPPGDPRRRKVHGRPDEEVLTMAQYWNDIIEKTRQHAEIESKRTLGHIYMGWEDEVGAELAKKYNAFSALILLTSEQAQHASQNDELPNFLDNQFADAADKENICKVLLETNSVLENLVSQTKGSTKVTMGQLRTEAILLVGPDAEYIGGEEVAQREIDGLFAIPSIKKKIAPYSLNSTKLRLKKLFADSGKNIQGPFEAIYTAWVGPDYTKEDASKILTAKYPPSKKIDIDNEIKKKKQQEAYERRYTRPATSDEIALLHRLGQNSLDSEIVHDISKVIQQATDLLDQTTDPDARSLLSIAQRKLQNNLTRNHGPHLDKLKAAIKFVESGERVLPPSPSAPVDAEDRIALVTAEKRDNLDEELELRARLAAEQILELQRLVIGGQPGKDSASTISELVQQLAVVETERARERLRADAAEATVQQQDATIVVLQGQISGLETALTEKQDSSTTTIVDLQAKLAAAKTALATRDTQLAEKDLQVANHNEALRRKVEENTQLTRELTTARDTIRGRGEIIASLTELLDAQTAPSTQPVIVDIFPAPVSKPEDISGLPFPAKIDYAAQKFFPPLAKIWEQEIYPKLHYKGHTGLAAIEHSLAPRIEKVLELTQESSQKWDMNKPEVRLMIGQHYANLLRGAGVDEQVERVLTTGIISFREQKSLPEEARYLDVLQILFYTQNEDMRSRCLQYLNSKSKVPQRAERIIQDYRTLEGRPRMEALHKIFERVVTGR